MPGSTFACPCPRTGPKMRHGVRRVMSRRRCGIRRGPSRAWRGSTCGGSRCRTAGSPAMMNWGATRGFAASSAHGASGMCWGCPAPPCTTTIRDLEAPGPVYQGRGRPPKPPWQSVTVWRHALDPAAWAHVTVRDGEKGPVGIEMVTRRVQTRLERKRTGPDEWLVVTRCPLADEDTLKALASPDAGDQDARYGYRYYLTPTCVAHGALADPSLGELA